MQQQNEKLSMLVDEQLDGKYAEEVLNALRHDRNLQSKFQRYHLISQAIKNDSCLTADRELVSQIQRKLRDEPIYLLPRRAQQKLEWQKTLGLAAAASVAVLAVLVFSNSEKHTQTYPRGENNLAQQSRAADNAKFKEYLQAHDNTWYVNNNVGVQQYARLAGYRQK